MTWTGAVTMRFGLVNFISPVSKSTSQRSEVPSPNSSMLACCLSSISAMLRASVSAGSSEVVIAILRRFPEAKATNNPHEQFRQCRFMASRAPPDIFSEWLARCKPVAGVLPVNSARRRRNATLEILAQEVPRVPSRIIFEPSKLAISEAFIKRDSLEIITVEPSSLAVPSPSGVFRRV
jgi:hypothetical protein